MIDASPVLTAVARLVAEAPSLREVVSRLAVTLRESIPFERLHVLRLDRAESFVLYVATAGGELEVTGHRIGDEGVPIDPADADTRSRILCTVRQGARVHGALWVASSQEHAFAEEHQALVDGVVDLLGLAFEHNAIVEREKLRRERIDSLRGLLHTMAESLDIRSVFSDIAEVVRGGLPHDILALTSWGEDGASFRVYAMAGAQVDEPAFWAPVALSGDDRAQLQRDAYVIHDVGEEIEPDSIRGRIFSRLAVRSALRVPMPLGSHVFGSLFFLSRQTDAFIDDDVDFARRVADHLALALSHERLAAAARRDAEAREVAARLEAQVATLTRELESRSGHRRLIGHSRLWKDVLAHAARVARTETTVLLTGESGTGKEVIARFIHHASRRGEGPFIAINCAALPDQLLESELFGHERGAFTGAVAAKPGRIEQANGGVLFLDEVGEMAPAVQAKMLRVLEEREFMRLGSTRVLRADIRVIAATNRDLHVGHAPRASSAKTCITASASSKSPSRRCAIAARTCWSWPTRSWSRSARPSAGRRPGSRARPRTSCSATRGRGTCASCATPSSAPSFSRTAATSAASISRSRRRARRRAAADGAASSLPVDGVNLEAIERSLVVKALTQARHNKTRAAKLLGLTRAQLYSRIEKYGLAETES